MSKLFTLLYSAMNYFFTDGAEEGRGEEWEIEGRGTLHSRSLKHLQIRSGFVIGLPFPVVIYQIEYSL